MDASSRLGFGLTCAAGLCTSLGAAVVVFVKPTNRMILSVCLAFSSGVMIYVSFTEIFAEATHVFEREYGPSKGRGIATASFFGGFLLVVILDLIVHSILGLQCCATRREQPEVSYKKSATVGSGQVLDTPEHQQISIAGLDSATALSSDQISLDAEIGEIETKTPPRDAAGAPQPPTLKDVVDQDKHSLFEAGMLSAIAIFIHNFPEGLSTYVATLANPSLGVAVAFAIGIHNIPEGICIAMPIYFSNQNKFKAILWGTISGLSEPAGALLAWGVLNHFWNDLILAFLFGLVSGMMVFISVKELLPAAFKSDHEGKCAGWSALAGMLVMAVSLVLFDL